jgi:hypothetical protein
LLFSRAIIWQLLKTFWFTSPKIIFIFSKKSCLNYNWIIVNIWINFSFCTLDIWIIWLPPGIWVRGYVSLLCTRIVTRIRGGFRGGAHPARAPPKIGKNMIFLA